MKQVIFDGHKFTKDEKTGYYLKTTKPRTRLHIYVWEYYNGCKVPKGFDIHHKDENKDNNDISNLECITRKRHNQIHKDSSRWTEQQMKEAKERMNHAREYANKWHKSKEGREWHKEQYKDTLGKYKQEKVVKKCEECGAKYEVNNSNASISRFCSNKCKSRYRRRMGLDNVERICEYCGKSYTCNKYKPTKYCSSLCASRAVTGSKRTLL